MKKFGLRLTTGIVILFAVIAVLCTNYQDMFLHGVWMIDTELNESGGDSFFVRTKVDFGEGDYMESLPDKVDDWYSAGDYDWAYIKEALGADAMLVRAYTKTYIYDVAFLLVAQSDDPSSFHPPPVFYRAQGYDIEEEGLISFTVPETDWAAECWRSEKEGNIFKGEFNAKFLVISKKDAGGKVYERMVALYYYVKHGGVVPDNITMIQVSAYVPVDLSYDGTFEMLEELMGDIVPVLFEPDIIEKEATAVHIVHKFGALGYLLIIAGLMVPVAIAFLPIHRLRIRKKHQSAPPEVR